MRRFTQLHLLTAYPPSNPNSDDLGRPKTATYGGVTRLRLSSQSIKRAARTGEVMRTRLEGHLGVRTRHIGEDIRRHLAERGVDEQGAIEIAATIAAAFGKVDAVALKAKPPEVRLRQLVYISPHEGARAMQWADRLAAGEALPDDLEERVLQRADTAIDIAMFGRDARQRAAVQPRCRGTGGPRDHHPSRGHRGRLLHRGRRSAQPSRGRRRRVSRRRGVRLRRLLPLCLHRQPCSVAQPGRHGGASRRPEFTPLVEALATGYPKGRRNGYGLHTRAGYVRAEAGDTQPRSLASAFLRPITGEDLMGDSACARSRGWPDGSTQSTARRRTSTAPWTSTAARAPLDEVQRFAGEQLDNA